jgi:hypothetical protein
VLKPYWKKAVEATPSGFAVPLKVAQFVCTAVAVEVTARAPEPVRLIVKEPFTGSLLGISSVMLRLPRAVGANCTVNVTVPEGAIVVGCATLRDVALATGTAAAFGVGWTDSEGEGETTLSTVLPVVVVVGVPDKTSVPALVFTGSVVMPDNKSVPVFSVRLVAALMLVALDSTSEPESNVVPLIAANVVSPDHKSAPVLSIVIVVAPPARSRESKIEPKFSDAPVMGVTVALPDNKSVPVFSVAMVDVPTLVAPVSTSEPEFTGVMLNVLPVALPVVSPDNISEPEFMMVAPV